MQQHECISWITLGVTCVSVCSEVTCSAYVTQSLWRSSIISESFFIPSPYRLCCDMPKRILFASKINVISRKTRNLISFFSINTLCGLQSPKIAPGYEKIVILIINIIVPYIICSTFIHKLSLKTNYVLCYLKISILSFFSLCSMIYNLVMIFPPPMY